MRAGTTALVSKKEMETVDGEVKRWERVESRRRRIREEMWAVVRDVLPEGTDVGDVMVSFCCLVGFVVDVGTLLESLTGWWYGLCSLLTTGYRRAWV